MSRLVLGALIAVALAFGGVAAFVWNGDPAAALPVATEAETANDVAEVRGAAAGPAYEPRGSEWVSARFRQPVRVAVETAPAPEEPVVVQEEPEEAGPVEASWYVVTSQGVDASGGELYYLRDTRSGRIVRVDRNEESRLRLVDVDDATLTIEDTRSREIMTVRLPE